jgi:hypothetical protein
MTPPTTLTAADGPGRPGERDWIDTAIEWTSGLAAVAMFAYGVALSYAVLYAIAEAAGLPPWARRLWPGGWELFMASAALNALAEQRHLRGEHGWRRVPWYPLALTGLTAGGSILLNWFHPAIPLDPPPGWLVSLVYGLPPLIAVFAWHLFLQRVAHRRHPTLAGTVPVVVPHEARPVPEDRGWDGAGGPAAADTGPAPTAPAPAAPPSRPLGPTPAGRVPARPAGLRPATGTARVRGAGLLAQARAAAAEHEQAHGRPISRDALRRALRVSNQTAGALLRQLRANLTELQPQPQDQDGATAARTSAPARSRPGPPAQRGPVAGNGAGGPPTGVAALVSGPVPGRDGREGTGNA